MMQILIFLALFLLHGINGQLLQPDNRCFLEDGGSTLTFFIKEDLTVGQQIGRLNIKGTVGRDIDLSVVDVNGLYDQLPVELEGMYELWSMLKVGFSGLALYIPTYYEFIFKLVLEFKNN